MHHTLRIATFNIHKGVTHLNARFALHHQRDLLRKLPADIVFLQEVREEHTPHRERFSDWPQFGQAEYLANAVWPDYAYGKNSVYPTGHHGNAILSKFPIINSSNVDISAHSSEQRGMLHNEINVPGWDQPLHTICLHLGLFAQWRRQQLLAVTEFIQTKVPADAPLIIAGDFNDWGMRTGRMFAKQLNMHEVFERHTGKPARSFPSWLPMLRLDRIYVRGFHVKQVEVHSGAQFIKISDHAMLTATLTRTVKLP